MESVLFSKIEDFGGAEGDGDVDSERVAVDAQGVAIAVEADRLDDWYDALSDQVLKEGAVDLVGLARVKEIVAFNNANRLGFDGVGDGALELSFRQRFEYLVRDAR